MNSVEPNSRTRPDPRASGPVAKVANPSPLLTRRKLLKAGAAVGALTLINPLYEETWLDYNQVHLHLQKWDRPNFRVAYISDLHLINDVAVRKTQSAIEWALGQKPDALLIGGDFVEMSYRTSYSLLGNALAPLAGNTIPCLAVMGNHDVACENPADVRRHIERSGIHILRNGVAEIGDVKIVGIDCMTYGYGRPSYLNEFANQQNVLVMVHEPDAVDDFAPNASLVLSGHSHGGQVCLPFGIPLHTPLLARKYISGYYPDTVIPLYVSRGLGEVFPRFRAYCRPEATLFTLDPA